MSFERVVLALNAAFVLFSGVSCLFGPASLAQQAGLSVVPRALTEIRAIYGGLNIGLGCFLIWCLRHRELTFAGLLRWLSGWVASAWHGSSECSWIETRQRFTS